MKPFCWSIDELIIEKEHYALIGDSLDAAFVDLMGMEPFWTDRNPKPRVPTPTPEEIAAAEAAREAKELSDAEAAANAAAASTELEGTDGAEATTTVDAETGEVIEKPSEPEVPKEPTPPPPPPPPFEYSIDLPPEGAEVPYVKNFDPSSVPPPAPEPANPEEATVLVEDESAPPADATSAAETPVIDAAANPESEALPVEATTTDIANADVIAVVNETNEAAVAAPVEEPTV